MSLKGRIKKGTLIGLTSVLLASCYFNTNPKKLNKKNIPHETQGIYCSTGNEVTELKLPGEYEFLHKIREAYDKALASLRNKGKSIDEITGENKVRTLGALAEETPYLEGLNDMKETYSNKESKNTVNGIVGKVSKSEHTNESMTIRDNKRDLDDILKEFSRNDIIIYKRLMPYMDYVKKLSEADFIYHVSGKEVRIKILQKFFDKNHREDLYYYILGLAAVESSGVKTAFNAGGNANGIIQMTPIGLEQVNNSISKYGIEIEMPDGSIEKLNQMTMKEMYNPKKAFKAALFLLDDLGEIFHAKNAKELSGDYSATQYNPEAENRYYNKLNKYAETFKGMDKVIKKSRETGVGQQN